MQKGQQWDFEWGQWLGRHSGSMLESQLAEQLVFELEELSVVWLGLRLEEMLVRGTHQRLS
jgi:hypothetical protein